eukprot:scaffold291405_cov34-Prasinocladus_malaysianus.AAC.1
MKLCPIFIALVQLAGHVKTIPSSFSKAMTIWHPMFLFAHSQVWAIANSLHLKCTRSSFQASVPRFGNMSQLLDLLTQPGCNSGIKGSCSR